jgi:hypothetical protein
MYQESAGSEELNDMKKESETKALEEWLRKVDKPLPTKHGDKKRRKTKRRGKQ